MKSLIFSIVGLLIGAFSATAQTGEWKVISTVPSGLSLTAVASPSDSVFLAIGYNGRIVRSADAGRTWTNVPSGLPDEWESILIDLSFGSALTGTTVGGSGNVRHTTNGGAVWTAGDVGVQGYLSSVDFLDENFGMIVGAAVLRTSDGGMTWESKGFNQEASIRDLVLLDTLRALAVGPAGFAGSGSIFRTNDGGATWSLVFVEGVGFGQFHQITFVDDRHGLIVGSDGTVLRTEDGGETWSLIKSGVAVELLAVAMHDPMNAVAVGAEGTIIRTTDGGRTWLEEASPTDEVLRGVSIDESGTVIAVGGDSSGIAVRHEPIPSGVVESGAASDEEFLVISPNPVSEEMRIQWRIGKSIKGRSGKGDVAIQDLLGKVVERFSVRVEDEGVVRSMESLPSGAYFVTLSFGEWRETTRMWVGGR